MDKRRPRFWLATLGLTMVLVGALLAHFIQTSGGTQVRDVRFRGADGTVMSALLYVPEGATPQARAPGILAVHGYINSRETQDGFAIEFARRGYVVLALDQTGHGYSGGKAFANGFGGPDGLAYLRALPMVDPAQIGLEGHSMGGWTVLAAAAAMPDAYRSMVLVGSSTGAPFAKDGTPFWPRNLALIFSRYDEFSQLMWGTAKAADVGQGAKLRAVFGTPAPVVPGQLYGSIADGTARYLTQPATTHPGDHFSNVAIGEATDWFARTLIGGRPLSASDQIWFWKEVGTGIALFGFLPLVLGLFDLLIALPPFASMRGAARAAMPVRNGRWWRSATLAAALPMLTFFPIFIAVTLLVPPTWFLPQTVTTQIAAWALVGAGLSLWLARGEATITFRSDWGRTIAAASLAVLAGYAVLALVQSILVADPRLWVVAIKPPSLRQWGIALIYVVPITLAFVATGRVLASLTVQNDSKGQAYLSAMLTLSGGFIVLLAVLYGVLLATGTLLTAFDPLSTVIAIQFVPVLAGVGAVMTNTWRRTGDYRSGAILSGLLVTLYVVAGTATQG